ncbi:MAG: thiol-disulfide oxidoreductase DCC family protein [Gemmatimonadota bacterium]|nr:thiol-disulfide oxidoreductase DCC family protein [Gemmatimonadota bacterium]
MSGDESTRSAGDGPILLFDGRCNLCSGTVNFVLPRDPEGRIRFASLQSEVGRELLEEAGVEPPGEDEDPESLVLLEDGAAHTESEAALRVAEKLQAPWPLFTVFRILPRALRDPVYRWVARNRYRWFGRLDSRFVPRDEVRDRFLD